MSVVSVFAKKTDYFYCHRFTAQVECVYVVLDYSSRSMLLFSERMNIVFFPIAISIEERDHDVIHKTQEIRSLVKDQTCVDGYTQTERSVWINVFVGFFDYPTGFPGCRKLVWIRFRNTQFHHEAGIDLFEPIRLRDERQRTGQGDSSN